MRFDWDDANRAHISDHDVSTQEAEELVLNDPIDIARQDESGEEHFFQIGETRGGRILLMASTMRGELVRVVTAYDAPKKVAQLLLGA